MLTGHIRESPPRSGPTEFNPEMLSAFVYGQNAVDAARSECVERSPVACFQAFRVIEGDEVNAALFARSDRWKEEAIYAAWNAYWAAPESMVGRVQPGQG